MNSPIPDTDIDCWAESQQLLGDYLPRIGAASDAASQQRLYCEVAGQLYDSWASRRIAAVQSEGDLSALDSDLATQETKTMRSLVDAGMPWSLWSHSVGLTLTGRRQHCLAEAVQRVRSKVAERRPKTSDEAPNVTVSQLRRSKIDAFIARAAEAGRKITRKDISTVAGYQSRSELERYQRADPKATKTATQAFERILGDPPEDFITKMDKRRSK